MSSIDPDITEEGLRATFELSGAALAAAQRLQVDYMSHSTYLGWMCHVSLFVPVLFRCSFQPLRILPMQSRVEERTMLNATTVVGAWGEEIMVAVVVDQTSGV